MGFTPLRRTMLVMLVAGALGACETLDSLDPFERPSTDFAAGSPVEYRLTSRDRDMLSEAFLRAVDTGAPQSWRGKHASGAVTPEGYAISRLKDDPDARIPAARGDLDLAHVVETELGLHVLTRNSNVRLGPGPENKAVEVLNSGAGVDVVGRVRDKNWMLVAVKGEVLGYVYGDLMIKAPGSELELAGGPMRKPVLCRNFTQTATVYAENVEWSGAVCNDGTGWRLAPPEPVEAAYDDGQLLDF